MAESVDALVSNTSGAIRAGSTPAQGTEKEIFEMKISFFILVCKLFYKVIINDVYSKVTFACTSIIASIFLAR